MKKQYLILFMAVLLLNQVFSQTNRFESIDQHVLNAPSTAGKSVENLAEYLAQAASNDLEKVRAFYVWISDNIAYDTKAFFSGSQEQYTAEEVLQRGKAVCQGYATLFKSLCDLENIHCMIIPGYSKGYGYNPNKPLDNTDHAWNAVKLNNQWYLLDVTWGSGHINEKNRFEKSFSEDFFLPDPATFVYRHLPADPMWQLLPSPVSLKLFQKDSSQIKAYLNTAEKNFNYTDSIASFMQLDETEKQIKSAYNEFWFNDKLSAPVGYIYMNMAIDLFNELIDSKVINPEEVISEKEKILGVYAKALDFFTLNNDLISIEGKSVCQKNIKQQAAYLDILIGNSYMNKASGLFKELLDNQDIDPAEAYKKQEYILGLYEKALYYFELNNDAVSRDARKICKQNIQSCKDNLEVYKKRMERGM